VVGQELDRDRVEQRGDEGVDRRQLDYVGHLVAQACRALGVGDEDDSAAS
jgi:hypothetical protein